MSWVRSSTVCAVASVVDVGENHLDFDFEREFELVRPVLGVVSPPSPGRIFECLDGTRDVALDDELELLNLALLRLREEVLERALHARLRKLGVAFACRTGLRDLTRNAILGDDQE